MVRLIGPRLPTSSQIRAFLALSRAGSYSSASRATGLSEASLHRSVADLAAALGAPVIERRGHSLLLTQRGKDAVRRFTLAIGEIESALVELAATQGRETGRIVIGAMPLSRSRLLPLTISAFRAAHPKVGLSIVEGSYADLIGPLREGHISIMLGALRLEPGPDLKSTPLFHDQPIIVGRAGHPLALSGDLSGPSLASYSWIVPGAGAPLRTLWVRMFQSLGTEPPPVLIECGSVITIRELLLGSDQLTLLSPDQVAVELEAGWLEKIGSAPGHLDRTIGVTVREDWRPTPLQLAFLGMLTKAAEACGHSQIRKNE